MVKKHVLLSKCKYLMILLHAFIVFQASVADLEQVEVKETDTVTLVCPRQSLSVAKLFVTYTDGQKEWYADFKADNTCSTLSSYMKCSKNSLSNSLTIPVSKTSRGIASYSCGDNLTYSVSFYAEPSDFKCGKPLLDSSGAFINITCNTSKIYPELTCGFKDVLNKSTTILLNEEVSYKLLESYGVPEYYKAQCTLSVNVTKLTFGEHQLQVTVQMKNIRTVEVNFSIEPSITLYPLKTRIDQSCPEGPNVVKGYILAGTNATCKCFKSTGYGTVFWTNGSIKVDQGDNYATLTVTYPTGHNKTFDCRASPYELDLMGTSFTAEFAYGPDELFISKSNIRMELCTETTVTCYTTNNYVNPSAQFEWSVNDPKAISIIPVIETSNFSSTVRLLALRPGKHIVTCKGYNTIFPDKDSEIYIVAVIKGTSFVQPRLTINQVQRLEGNSEIVNITCSTDVESDLSLTCLNKTIINRASTLTIVHTIKDADNGVLCSCSSEYLCNMKQTEKATIFLAYGPMQFIITTRAVEFAMCERELIPAVVPKNEGFKSALFNISVNEPDSLQWEVLFGNGTATIEVFSLKAGQFQMTVEVYNSYDLSSKTASAIDVLVLDAKLPKPSLIVNHGRIVKEEEKDSVEIACRFPSINVTRGTLDCLGTTVTSNGTDIIVHKNVTRSHNGATCTCHAQYNTNCNFQGTTTTKVNVTYEATISKFTVNENNSNILVSEGEDVTIEIIVTSNPQPYIYIETEEIKGHLNKISYTDTMSEIRPCVWRLHIEIRNISCEQSSNYTSIVRNNLFSKIARQTVSVLVKCSLKLLNQNLKFQRKFVKEGGLVFFPIKILGYPRPNIWTLLYGASKQVADTNSYTVLYQEETPFIGTLWLRIDIVHEESFTLNIGNGRLPVLEADIFIEEDDESDDHLKNTVYQSIIGVLVFGICTLTIIIFYCCKRKQGFLEIFRKRQRSTETFEMEHQGRIEADINRDDLTTGIEDEAGSSQELNPTNNGSSSGNRDESVTLQERRPLLYKDEAVSSQVVNPTMDGPSTDNRDESVTLQETRPIIHRRNKNNEMTGLDYMEIKDLESATPLSPTFVNSDNTDIRGTTTTKFNVINQSDNFFTREVYNSDTVPKNLVSSKTTDDEVYHSDTVPKHLVSLKTTDHSLQSDGPFNDIGISLQSDGPLFPSTIDQQSASVSLPSSGIKPVEETYYNETVPKVPVSLTGTDDRQSGIPYSFYAD